ncbi:hypothetical protein MDG893_19389 [Marinobacter algicola DG893]|uniref:Uncharacterized protein n=1 Tax=Marinobacter algicola DG893 TaxID=443152 RepID=A6F3P7_9GAMM|nr:hypothetical protein MDG893_19389 [Marinobacter algicola DG893]
MLVTDLCIYSYKFLQTHSPSMLHEFQKHLSFSRVMYSGQSTFSINIWKQYRVHTGLYFGYQTLLIDPVLM